MMHRSAAGTKAAMVKRMKIGEEEEKKKKIDEANRRHAALQSAADSDLGFELLEVYVSQELEEKLLPGGKQKKEGGTRVWTMGDINQVPSWSSCHSIAFRLAARPLRTKYKKKSGPKVRCCVRVCTTAEFPRLFSELLQSCTATCLDVDE